MIASHSKRSNSAYIYNSMIINVLHICRLPFHKSPIIIIMLNKIIHIGVQISVCMPLFIAYLLKFQSSCLIDSSISKAIRIEICPIQASNTNVRAKSLIIRCKSYVCKRRTAAPYIHHPYYQHKHI